MILLGMLGYAGSILFYFVTLPVEFDASNRAMAELERLGAMDLLRAFGLGRAAKGRAV